MAENGSNNWLWWSIGGIATLGLGLGVYYFIKSNKDAKAKEEEAKKNASSATTYTPPVYVPPSTTTTNTTATETAPTPTYTLKSTPFTSVEQSNAFRAWVNDKDPAFAKEIELEMNKSTTSSMNNDTIQKAWGKYSDVYYTDNANALGFLMQTITGGQKIDGGVEWKSTDAVPRGEVRMYTDGKITANAVNSQGEKTKYVQGGWYKVGLSYYVMIGGVNYPKVLNVGLRDVFWSILKKAGIYSSDTNSYSAFNANMSTPNFGLTTDGTIQQDELL